MKNEKYYRNIVALKERQETLGEKIENRNFEKIEAYKVSQEKSIDGNPIFAVTSDQRKLYLQGKYNSLSDYDKWIKEQKKFERGSVYILVGSGNPTFIKRLLNETKEDSIIIVYEPSINIFLKVIEEIDISDLIKSGKVSFFIDGINGEDVKQMIDDTLVFDNLNILHHHIMGNYTEIFPNQIRDFFAYEKERMDFIKRSYYTLMNFTDVNGLNVLNNFRMIVDNYTTHQLKESLPPEIPCIIVAAGPSLNKNIMDLKLAKNRACIIATDTALKPLLNNGIKPDFVAVVDGKKETILFDHEMFKHIPMLMSPVASREAVNKHTGKKYFSWDGTVYETELVKIAKENSNQPEKIDLLLIPTGGSVATTAFSIANIIGSKTIILVGQDLALTGNKSHADGTFKEKMETLDTSKGTYVEVEDVFGGKVLTRKDYKSYLDWYNRHVPLMKDKKVIDATEGGAKITGTEIMTLKEAIDRECKVETDIEGIFNSIPPVFHEEKVKKAVINFFTSTIERMDELKEKLEKGIAYYEKIIKICEKQNFNQKEYMKLSNKISNINNFIDKDGVSLLVIDSMRHVDYSLRAVVYNTEEKEETERLNIAKHGKSYLEAMKLSLENLYDYAKETVGKVGE